MEMKSYFERDMNHNYLVIEEETFFDGEDSSKDYRERMILENQIPGLLPIEKRKMNGKTKYYYDINQMQTLESLYEKREMNFEELHLVLQGCAQMFHNLWEYLLEGEQIILDPSHIYIHMETKRPFFLYVLFYEKDIRKSFLEFTDYLLSKIDHTQEQTVMLGYQVYKYTRTPNFTFENIGEIIKKYEIEKNTQVNQEPKQEAVIQAEDDFIKEAENIEEIRPVTIHNDHLQERESYRQKKAGLWMSMLFSICGILSYILIYYFQFIVFPQSARLYFFAGIMISFTISVLCMISIWKEKNTEEIIPEETSYFPAEQAMEGTVLLKKQHYLEGTVNGRKEKILLDRFPVTIGKQDCQSDVVIHDNTVSRKHARLEQHHGKIFLSDLHSTNGTKKNGVYLEEDNFTELLSGDEVTFGGASFTYI